MDPDADHYRLDPVFVRLLANRRPVPVAERFAGYIYYRAGRLKDRRDRSDSDGRFVRIWGRQLPLHQHDVFYKVRWVIYFYRL